jgi:hypothetical protein
MPKGPKGEKRPADTNACAVMVARIATGETEEAPIVTGGRKVGGLARARALSPERRKEVAQKAARVRWRETEDGKVETTMAVKETGKVEGRRGEKLALMYPTNQLGAQVRGYEETRGVGALIKREFFDNK